MILDNLTQSGGTGIISVLVSAGIWVFSMFIVLAHRAGIQLLGVVIALIGLVSLFSLQRVFLSLSLLFVGIFVHGCGRLLLYLKRR